MLTGLSIALLSMASVLGFASYSIAMLAGFIPTIFFLQGEIGTGRLVYAATAVLALLVVPDKEVAFLYACFFGLYTVLKYEIERLHRLPLEVALKLAGAAAWAGITLGLIRFGLVPELPQLSTRVILLVFAGWMAFIVYYDFCLTCIFGGLKRLLKKFHL